MTIPQPPPDVPSTPSIGDYGLIGDMRTAALIDRWGRMDWLCWPRFDSPPLLRRLIDPYAGTWQVAPTVPFDAARRYLPDTNVLETTFACADGVTITQDFMAVPVEGLGGSRVIRIIEGRSGAVPIRMSLRASRGFRPGTARLGVRDGELLVGSPQRPATTTKRWGSGPGWRTPRSATATTCPSPTPSTETRSPTSPR